jgi:hypothetical protein
MPQTIELPSLPEQDNLTALGLNKKNRRRTSNNRKFDDIFINGLNQKGVQNF